MTVNPSVIEYKCPCCDAGLVFGQDVQQMTCAYCDNTFDLDTVKAFADSRQSAEESFQWEESTEQTFSESEEGSLRAFVCPSCGGEIITDENTAATFCPYCANPTILPGRVSGGLKPDGVIPFQTTKEDAQKAFANLCKGKPLLPKDFAAKHRLAGTVPSSASKCYCDSTPSPFY